MRAVVTVAVLALSLAPAASAKFQISLSLSNDEPRVRQAVRAVIRTDERVGRTAACGCWRSHRLVRGVIHASDSCKEFAPRRMTES
jgi:hypothetical protein